MNSPGAGSAPPLGAPTIEYVIDSGALVALAVGLVVGLATGLFLQERSARRPRRPHRGRRPAPPSPQPAGALPSGAELFGVLRGGAVLLDARDDVLLANADAESAGIVRDGRVTIAELRRLAGETRTDGEVREVEIDLPSGRLGYEPMAVRARLAALADGTVVLLVEDITESRRVEAVRRDFVANVSHELKTPVGAMALLAEALIDASEDADSVRRFGGRIQHESARLSRLVQELIDLSRLQGADPLPDADVVAIDQVVSEAEERTRLAAAARDIEVVRAAPSGLTVLGSEQQLVTALVNLIDNAIHYSPDHTRVAIGVQPRDDAVEITVSDQGIGIAERDLDRIFERFYRADPARSRATGGTGLGLSIVKHIATNHGGSVGVWSVEGAGSTFTIRLPVSPAGSDAASPEMALPRQEIA